MRDGKELLMTIKKSDVGKLKNSEVSILSLFAKGGIKTPFKMEYQGPGNMGRSDTWIYWLDSDPITGVKVSVYPDGIAFNVLNDQIDKNELEKAKVFRAEASNDLSQGELSDELHVHLEMAISKRKIVYQEFGNYDEETRAKLKRKGYNPHAYAVKLYGKLVVWLE